MNGGTQIETGENPVTEEAARWIARMDQGALTEEDCLAFAGWLNADARHRAEMLEMADMWSDMDQLTELFQPRPVSENKYRSFLKPPAFATAFAFMLIAFIGVSIFSDMAPTSTNLTFATQVGAYENTDLADGSTIELNTATKIETHFDNRRREVALLAGEALFTVAKDVDRPFVVIASNFQVEAVGTRFNVQLHNDQIEVIVTEGTVKISPTDGSAGAVFANAGEITNITSGGITLIGDISSSEQLRLLSWRDGILNYGGETLAEVVADFGRYNDLEIIITDADARNIRVGGYFNKNDVAAFLEALETGFPIEVDRVSDAIIHLSASE